MADMEHAQLLDTLRQQTGSTLSLVVASTPLSFDFPATQYAASAPDALFEPHEVVLRRTDAGFGIQVETFDEPGTDGFVHVVIDVLDFIDVVSGEIHRNELITEVRLNLLKRVSSEK